MVRIPLHTEAFAKEIGQKLHSARQALERKKAGVLAVCVAKAQMELKKNARKMLFPGMAKPSKKKKTPEDRMFDALKSKARLNKLASLRAGTRASELLSALARDRELYQYLKKYDYQEALLKVFV